jgi:hypothetical protein
LSVETNGRDVKHIGGIREEERDKKEVKGERREKHGSPLTLNGPFPLVLF